MRKLMAIGVMGLLMAVCFETGRLRGTEETFREVGHWWSGPTGDRDVWGKPCDFWSPPKTTPRLFYWIATDDIPEDLGCPHPRAIK